MVGGRPNITDVAFLLTVRSFLLTVDLFYLQLTILAFLLTVRSFLLTVELFCLQLTSLAFFTYNWSFFAYNFSFLYLQLELFFAYNGKVRLIRALTDCKQRSLTVSKKAPTVSKKASP